jgi:hypothetical protein
MTTQDTVASRLTHTFTLAYLDARYVGDGVILFNEDVIVNVSDDGKNVDVARIVRDEDEAPVDSVEYLTEGSARNGKRIMRAVLAALSA